MDRQPHDHRGDRADLDRAFVELAACLGAVDGGNCLGMSQRDPADACAQIDGGRGSREDSIHHHARWAERRKARRLVSQGGDSPGQNGRCPGEARVGEQGAGDGEGAAFVLSRRRHIDTGVRSARVRTLPAQPQTRQVLTLELKSSLVGIENHAAGIDFGR